MHQAHFYVRGISAIFSRTGKLIYVVLEFIVIPGNVNSCFFRTDVTLSIIC